MRDDVKQYLVNKALLSLQTLDNIMPKGTSDALYQDFIDKLTALKGNDLLTLIESYPLDLYKEYIYFQKVLKGEISVSDWVAQGRQRGGLNRGNSDYSFLKPSKLSYDENAKKNAELATQIDSSLTLEDDVYENKEDETDDEDFNIDSLMQDIDMDTYAVLAGVKSAGEPTEFEEDRIEDVASQTDAKDETAKTEADDSETEELNAEDIDNIFEEVDSSEKDVPSGFIILDTMLDEKDIASMTDEQVVMLIKSRKIAVPDDIKMLSPRFKDIVEFNALTDYTAKDDEKPKSFDELLAISDKVRNPADENIGSSIENSSNFDKLYIDTNTNRAAERIMEKLDSVGILDKIPDISFGSSDR